MAASSRRPRITPAGRTIPARRATSRGTAPAATAGTAHLQPPRAFAAGAQAGPPAIPHDLAGRDNCLMCHNPEGGLKPAPGDHAGRTNDSCQMCHKPAAATEQQLRKSPRKPRQRLLQQGAQTGSPAIPHDLAGRDNCLLCHNPDGGVKPAPTDHAGRTNDQCQTCHKPATAPAVDHHPGIPSEDEEGEREGPPAIPHDLAGRDQLPDVPQSRRWA